MAECLTPFAVKGVLVPCGKCPTCRLRRASQWSFRLRQQDKVSISSHFITLTYDTKYVPLCSAGRMSLCKRDVQLFFKRLRKAHGKSSAKISYYLAGEYGDRYWRPHYHCILFNARMELIQPAWGLGDIHYGDVSGASIGYTLKYICKDKRVPQYAADTRVREFALMSKGLGISYLSEAMIDYHWSDPVDHFFCTYDGGKKMGLPRYYKQKLFTDEECKAFGTAVRARVLARKAEKLEDSVRFSRIEAAFRRAAVANRDTGRF